jgi:hypothetical protein
LNAKYLFNYIVYHSKWLDLIKFDAVAVAVAAVIAAAVADVIAAFVANAVAAIVIFKTDL